MEHPFTIVRRVCNQKKIHPVELLGELLAILTENHQMGQGFFHQQQGQQWNVYGEIAGFVQMFGRTNAPPKSLIEYLDWLLNFRQSLDRQNAQNQNVDPTERDNLSHRADIYNAMRLILRELMNQSEHEGLEARLRFEKIAKEQGWTTERTDVEPPPGQGEEDTPGK